MRTVIAVCILVVVLAWTNPVNKLENTRWAGVINTPMPVDAVCEFKKDSSLVFVDNQVIETMSYTVSGDTLTLTKLGGTSPCSGEKGVYRFSITNDVFKVEVIDDACGPRAAAWDPNGYKKQ